MADAKATPEIIVPLHNAPFCNQKSPDTNKPCRRAAGHDGRHAFIRQHVSHGLVREVWG